MSSVPTVQCLRCQTDLLWRVYATKDFVAKQMKFRTGTLLKGPSPLITHRAACAPGQPNQTHMIINKGYVEGYSTLTFLAINKDKKQQWMTLLTSMRVCVSKAGCTVVYNSVHWLKTHQWALPLHRVPGSFIANTSTLFNRPHPAAINAQQGTKSTASNGPKQMHIILFYSTSVPGCSRKLLSLFFRWECHKVLKNRNIVDLAFSFGFVDNNRINGTIKSTGRVDDDEA